MAEGVNVGAVYVDVLPDARQFNTKLAEIARNASVMVKVDADTAAAKAKIDALTGGDVRAKVDVDDGEARAKLDEVTRDREAKVKVDADTAGAEAKIDALNQSAGSAGGGMGLLMTSALTLGPALIPVGAAALGVAAALGTLGVAGVAGAGILTIAIGGVTNAVKLLGQQQTQQAAASQAAGQSAAAHAQAIVAAQRQIESAQMSLADAQRSAADQQIQDSQAVQSAQYGLAQADQAEVSAVNALVTAREAAARQLESYANQAVDARLAEQQAVIDLENAQKNYATTMASQTATQVQRQQAALDLQKAQQRIVETQQAATNATQDNTKAQQQGVDGSPQVVSATQAVATAQHNQQQAAQSLADAQRKAAEDQIKSQESIVRAQQGVAAAMDAMAAAQRNSAGSTNTSLAATNAAIAKLDPATRSFAEYIRGTLGPVWHGLAGTIAEGLFPGMQAGIEAMMPDLPILTRFLGNASKAMGDLFESAGKALASPFWQNFFNMLADNIGPWLTALGTIFGDLITGFAGLFQAMVPIANQVIPWIVSLADGFAKFGQSAGSNSGFQQVIQYIKDSLPAVGQVIRDLLTAFGHIIEALAPIGPPLLAIIDGIIGVFNRIPIHVLTDVALGIMAIIAAQKIWAGIQSIGSIIGSIAEMGPWALALAAIAGAVLLVYANSKTFRDFVANQVVPTLKSWGDWIMQNVVPALSALWDWIVNKLVPVLAGIFMAAWHGIQDAVTWVSQAVNDNRGELKQLWDVLSGVIGFIVTNVLPIVGTILKTAFDVLGIAIHVVIDIVSTLIDMWNAMWQVGKDLGAWFSGPFVGFFVGAWNAIRDGWRTLVTDIKNLWQDIEHWVMDPVAWVVRFVINDGLIKAWDWISDHLLGGALHANPMDVPSVPPLAAANGAVIPGYAPGRDSVHAILSPGEGVLVPEAVRGLGGAPAIHALNAAYSSRVPGPTMKGGLARFDGGGIWGDIIGTIGEAAAPGVFTAAKALGKSPGDLASLLTDPIGGLGTLVKSLMGGVGKAGPFIDMLGQMAGGLASGVGKAILGLVMPGGGSYANYLGGFSAAQLQAAGAAGQINLGNLGSAFYGTPQNAQGNAGIVQQMAAARGWTGAEWSALYNLVMRESGFRNTAQNPTSTAYGMFQFLDSTWAGYGGGKTSDPTAQTRMGLDYIASRYRDPLGAWAHEVSAGWYDQGGLLPTGPSLVYNGTGQPELIAPEKTFRDVMSGASGGAASNLTGMRIIGTLDLGGGLEARMDGRIAEAFDLATSRSVNN